MDTDLIKSLASQGIFAVLFGYLGQRQLKAADRLQDQNDKMTAQLFELSRQSLDHSKASIATMERVTTALERFTRVAEKILERIDK